jgi:hypothetical protein
MKICKFCGNEVEEYCQVCDSYKGIDTPYKVDNNFRLIYFYYENAKATAELDDMLDRFNTNKLSDEQLTLLWEEFRPQSKVSEQRESKELDNEYDKWKERGL